MAELTWKLPSTYQFHKYKVISGDGQWQRSVLISVHHLLFAWNSWIMLNYSEMSSTVSPPCHPYDPMRLDLHFGDEHGRTFFIHTVKKNRQTSRYFTNLPPLNPRADRMFSEAEPSKRSSATSGCTSWSEWLPGPQKSAKLGIQKKQNRPKGSERMLNCGNIRWSKRMAPNRCPFPHWGVPGNLDL